MNAQQKRKPIHLLKALNIPAGAWQLFWFGRLTDSPNAKQTPFIRAYLARVELLEGQIVDRLPDVVHVDLPVSDLPALPLGTVFADRLIIPAMPLHPTATWEDITVDLTRQNLRLVERVALEPDGRRFLPRGRRTPVGDQEYEGLLLTAGDNANPHAFVFPCTTIFQFFWARSSKWAQLMVDGRFVDYNRYIFDARKSYLSSDGREARLWLRQWMLDDDAAFIATLAFDEYALGAGADIYRYLAQAPRETDRRCIRALPPYQGHIPLRVLQQPITTRHGPAMLIQCISNCGYTPSIKELKFDRDNDGRTIDEVAHGDQGDKLPINRPQFGGPPVTLLDQSATMTSDPHASQKGSIEISMAHLSDSLPGLSFISVEKLPQTDTQYVNQQEAVIRLQQWAEEISTLTDALSSGDLAPEGLIRGENHTDAFDSDDITPVRGDISELAHALLSGEHFEVLDGEAKWTAEPSLVVMPRQQGYYFPVPALVDGMALAWLYRDEEKLFRKRALCIRVTFTRERSGRSITRYLLDFEPRATGGTFRQTSILFFWNMENTALPGEARCIRNLVKAIAKKGQAGIPKEAMDGLEGRTRNHPPTGMTPHRFLKSMLEAVDRM
ncbi:hypothetical protein NU688_29895 [Variovorax sp. ZS18.2.2]|uniref:hypothetical protein n=1 Tax=Variovorax sp. ZS18.2.2 TaxID=2971255 RepID=UPI002151AEA1|nr:hypothetical protein [Variovorax sp. ZS18.2.2]MCR6480403.1 hypothetical protein [Variovorax sp. ZS18.2.2]